MTTYYKTTEHLRSTIDDREWIVPPPAEIRQYPRSPYEAVLHAIEYLDSPFIAPVPWKGRGMTAVARCYGLQTAETGRIPATIPGPRYSAIRQFRWLMQTYPEYAVPAPNPYTFGADVPMGAVVYWDESSPSGGGVGRPPPRHRHSGRRRSCRRRPTGSRCRRTNGCRRSATTSPRSRRGSCH